MEGVREYVNGESVELWMNKAGRLMIRASNECGNACTLVDLVSVSKLLESIESFGFKGGGLIREGAANVDA